MDYVFAEKQIEPGVKVVVSNDIDPISPRDKKLRNPATQMIFWRRRDPLGDEHNYDDPEHMHVSLQLEYNPDLFGEYEYDMLEYIPEELHKDIMDADIPGVLKDVYIYEHGNIALSFGQFSCPWDSGWLGFIHISPETIKERGWTMEQAEECARAELKQYQQYINGEVYYMGIYFDGLLDDGIGDIYASEPESFPSDKELDDIFLEHVNFNDEEIKSVRETPWTTMY